MCVVETLKGFLVPRRLVCRLRNLILLAVAVLGMMHHWSGENVSDTRTQRLVSYNPAKHRESKYSRFDSLPTNSQPKNSNLSNSPQTREVRGHPRLSRSSIDRQPEDVTNRHLHIRDRCANLDTDGSQANNQSFLQSAIIAENILYCPVSGAASTFIRRFLAAIDDLKMKSPFDVRVRVVHKDRMEHLSYLGSNPDQKQFLLKATKFMFGRNPLSRIFSLYINKLYPPDQIFWLKWGKKSVNLPTHAAFTIKCGAFIHFGNFIKLVIGELSKLDEDLIPATTLCQLCTLDYDVIGKVENAVTDIRYLAGRLNASSKFMDQPKYLYEATYDAVKHTVREMFHLRNEDGVKKCISTFDLGRMTWRKLQITGTIDARLHFPLTEEGMETVSLENFVNLCFTAAKNSTDKQRLESQRGEAMSKAYSSVELADLEAIQKIYSRDFYLFGYEFNATAVFLQRGKERRFAFLQILNWQNPWGRP